MKIKWYKVSGAKHYKVYRKTQSKKYKLVKKTEKRVFVDEKLKSNKKYFYKVKAFKKNKKSYKVCNNQDTLCLTLPIFSAIISLQNEQMFVF